MYLQLFLQLFVDWRFLLLLFVILNYVVRPILNKKIADRGSRTRSLVGVYVASFVFAILAWAVFTPVGDVPSLGILAIGTGLGILNGIANYCNWRAVAISQSGTALTTQLDDLITLGLGYALLGETRYLSWPLGVGIVLSLGSAFLLSVYKSAEGGRDAVPFRRLLGWVLAYSCIWGVEVFAYRCYSMNRVNAFAFLLCIYGGSLIAAFGVRRVMGSVEAGDPLTGRERRNVAMLAAMNVVAAILLYRMSGFAPITYTQPTLQASELVFPALIGLRLFRERNQFTTWPSRLLFVSAFVGGLICAFAGS